MAANTVLLCVDVHGEVMFDAVKSGILQFCDTLCLQEGALPLPRVGLCALTRAAGAAKVQLQVLILQFLNLRRCAPPHARPDAFPPVPARPATPLQVKLRPCDLSLRELHVATAKLQRCSSADGVAGADAALAVHSLAQLLCQDKSLGGGRRGIVLLTDRLYPADDFATFLDVNHAKGVRLDILAVAEQGAAGDAAAAHAWGEAEAAHPGQLGLTLVEAAGALAGRAVARALLHRYAPPSPPTHITLQFPAPLVGDVRAVPLEARCDVLRLSRRVDRRALCPCHGAPVAPAGGDACAVTGAALAPGACPADGRVVQVGPRAAGTLHLLSPLSLAGGGGGGGAAPAVLHVVRRVPIASVATGLLCGPPVVLRAGGGGGGGVKVAVEGELVDLTPAQLLGVVTAALEGEGEGLLCHCAADLRVGGAPALFRTWYLLAPAAAAASGGGGGGPALCAMRWARRSSCTRATIALQNQKMLLIWMTAPVSGCRVASLEELAPAAVAAPGPPPPAPPPAVVEAVQAQLRGLELGALDPLACSSKMHETIQVTRQPAGREGRGFGGGRPGRALESAAWGGGG
jgi:hypothetical protein